MAKRNNPPVSAAEPVHVCGDCSHATDFCVRGFGGRPVLCMCGEDRSRYRITSEQACQQFSVSPDGMPSDVPVVPVPVLLGGERVVPIYGNDPHTPVRVVPADGLHSGMTEKEIMDVVSGSGEGERVAGPEDDFPDDLII